MLQSNKLLIIFLFLLTITLGELASTHVMHSSSENLQYLKIVGMISYLQKYWKHDSLLYSGELEFPNPLHYWDKKNVMDSGRWQSFLRTFTYYCFLLAECTRSYFKAYDIKESEQEKSSHVFVYTYRQSLFLIQSSTEYLLFQI